MSARQQKKLKSTLPARCALLVDSRLSLDPSSRASVPETIEQFILDQLDRAGLGHNTFTAEALALIVRSGEGLLRRTRNLCLSSLIETVRDQTRVVDLKQVNRVLLQPHWRKDYDNPLPATPLVA